GSDRQNVGGERGGFGVELTPLEQHFNDRAGEEDDEHGGRDADKNNTLEDTFQLFAPTSLRRQRDDVDIPKGEKAGKIVDDLAGVTKGGDAAGRQKGLKEAIGQTVHRTKLVGKVLPGHVARNRNHGNLLLDNMQASFRHQDGGGSQIAG